MRQQFAMHGVQLTVDADGGAERRDDHEAHDGGEPPAAETILCTSDGEGRSGDRRRLRAATDIPAENDDAEQERESDASYAATEGDNGPRRPLVHVLQLIECVRIRTALRRRGEGHQ